MTTGKRKTALIGLTAFVAAVFYRPVVLNYGWEHFVVPLGVPSMTYWQAFGLFGVVYTATNRMQSSDETKDGALLPLSVLLSLSITHLVLWLVAS